MTFSHMIKRAHEAKKLGNHCRSNTPHSRSGSDRRTTLMREDQQIVDNSSISNRQSARPVVAPRGGGLWGKLVQKQLTPSTPIARQRLRDTHPYAG